MYRITVCAVCIYLLHLTQAVKVKVTMHSEQDESKVEEEDSPHTESWDSKKLFEITLMPFIKNRKHEKQIEYDEYKSTTEKPRPVHPNELFFSLIYKQSHINNMFKYGDNWYTWSTETRSDGSKAVNYFICYEEPKHCDEVGWERIDTLPKCAFQIDSLLPEDRACVNSFGIEPRRGVACDGGDQIKVSEMVRSCGPRIRSLWRFVRASRRPANAAKPADVNSLICEDEEECYVTVEYRIHHDRITFSLHEPARGQTFKSALKREIVEEETKAIPTVDHVTVHRAKKVVKETSSQKKRVRPKTKVEGKGVTKERNDSGYTSRRHRNKVQYKEDISNDTSE